MRKSVIAEGVLLLAVLLATSGPASATKFIKPPTAYVLLAAIDPMFNPDDYSKNHPPEAQLRFVGRFPTAEACKAEAEVLNAEALKNFRNGGFYVSLAPLFRQPSQ